MPLTIKSHHIAAPIDSIIGINIKTGEPLQGEKDIYERIVKDCTASPFNWFMWYDKTFEIENGIQIDFLLICEEGAIVIEVKGGEIEINYGHYYYSHRGRMTPLGRSPFDQASSYKWKLMNHRILNKDVIFVDYACAFPHSKLDKTSKNQAEDLGWRLWNKNAHDSNKSFADFCLSVIRRSKTNSKHANRILTTEELNAIIESLAPSFENPNKYSLTSLSEVLNWLHIDNLDTLRGLEKNPRILIEGGPGTGKTTMAKAYIKRHPGLKGLYLCWTGLLASKIQLDLNKEQLLNCDVKTYNSYIKEITENSIDVDKRYRTSCFRDELEKALLNIRPIEYDYIIVDEAQDVADKGLDLMLHYAYGKNRDGLKSGRYLIFYDLEQGYSCALRNLEESLSSMSNYGALYILDENKRVVTNKHIVDYANEVLNIDQNEASYESYIKSLCQKDIPGLRICIKESVRDVKKAIKEEARAISEYSLGLSTTTLLVHSDLNAKVDDESILDVISDMELLYQLSEKSIERKGKESLAYSTILKYKGLEDNNIILVLPYTKIKSSWENFLFEIYVGMTRAMMQLSIIILKDS